MLVLMRIYFAATSYDKRTYARFRSSVALERFDSSPLSEGRAASIKWARAWLLVPQHPDNGERLEPCTSSPQMDNSFRNSTADKHSLAEEDSFTYRD